MYCYCMTDNLLTGYANLFILKYILYNTLTVCKSLRNAIMVRKDTSRNIGNRLDHANRWPMMSPAV